MAHKNIAVKKIKLPRYIEVTEKAFSTFAKISPSKPVENLMRVNGKIP